MAKDMKGKKNLILSAAIAFVVIVIVVIVFLPNPKKGKDGPEVISRKVKLDLVNDAVKTEDMDERIAKPVVVEEVKPVAVVESKAKEAKPEEVKKTRQAEPAPVKKVSAPKKTKRVQTASVDKTALAASKPWAVNIASFSHKSEADRLAKTLVSAGYNAYTTSFTRDGIDWTRVRVGFYSTKDDAQKVGDALKKRYRLGSPWIVKPASDETARHIR